MNWELIFYQPKHTIFSSINTNNSSHNLPPKKTSLTLTEYFLKYLDLVCMHTILQKQHYNITGVNLMGKRSYL